MITRRQLMQNAAASGVAGLSQAMGREQTPVILRLQTKTLEINGKSALVYSIAQPNGVQGITLDYGEPFHVRVENQLNEPSLIHWHGLTPPFEQDGVPNISGPAISPGQSATYNFPQTFGGTYWMHSHYGLQEQQLMAAPLIIRYPKKYSDHQDIVVMIADFSFTSPQRIYAELTKGRIGRSEDDQAKDSLDTEKMNKDHAMMAHDPDHFQREHGSCATSHDHEVIEMNENTHDHVMGDFNDVAYDAFLANNRTLSDPEIIAVSDNGRVLLRVINGATMSNFHVNLGKLQGTLVAVDGQEILPITGSFFPIAAGQRLDILLEIHIGEVACPVFFHLEGDRKRTGVILASRGARVKKYSDISNEVAPAIDLSLEKKLRAAWPLVPHAADRFYSMDLTGDMSRYTWSINNVVWSPLTPSFALRKGERVEIAITNKTMMAHPMHLHGHRFQVVEIDNRRFSGAMRDTIHIPPGNRVVVAFDADNPGLWAFHCHLAYHMHAGMFTTFRYI